MTHADGVLLSRVHRGLRPVGTFDNSPAVHCWEQGKTDVTSPVGTIEEIPEVGFQSSLRDEQCSLDLYPAMNRWAIFNCPSGTKALVAKVPAIVNHYTSFSGPRRS